MSALKTALERRLRPEAGQIQQLTSAVPYVRTAASRSGVCCRVGLSECALHLRKPRDETSGRPAQNAVALVVIELGGVLKVM